MVIEALKEVKPERKCFRMVGGVLIERTVKEVLPPLEGNNEQVGSYLLFVIVLLFGNFVSHKFIKNECPSTMISKSVSGNCIIFKV